MGCNHHLDEGGTFCSLITSWHRELQRVRIAMKFSRNRKRPMWNCDQSILGNAFDGPGTGEVKISHNDGPLKWRFAATCENELQNMRTLFPALYQYSYHTTKSTNCLCTCGCIKIMYYITYTYWKLFEMFVLLSLSLSLSLFASLNAYVFKYLYKEHFWRESPEISAFQSNSYSGWARETGSCTLQDGSCTARGCAYHQAAR